MEDDHPLARHSTLTLIMLTARDAVTVTRLLALRPPCCPLVRAAFARVLLETLNAWSRESRPSVRPAADARRTPEPALRVAREPQPRKGEAR